MCPCFTGNVAVDAFEILGSVTALPQPTRLNIGIAIAAISAVIRTRFRTIKLSFQPRAHRRPCPQDTRPTRVSSRSLECANRESIAMVQLIEFAITSVHSWQDVPLHLQLPIAPVSGISICNMSQIPCWNVLSLRMDQTNGPLVTPTASNPHSVSVQVLHCSYLAATVGIDLALQFGLTDNSILF